MASTRPVPFRYYDDYARNTPWFRDDEDGDLTAVLKGLAKGSYPRIDAVPLALNAYNCNRTTGIRATTSAYFHPITTIAPLSRPPKYRPELNLDARVVRDLELPWHAVRPEPARAVEESTRSGPPARYRFVCFIHKHRIDLKSSSQKAVYTISIWDRELTWHDTYPLHRKARRDEIREFWQTADLGVFPVHTSRAKFLGSIRYRTVYHTCEQVGILHVNDVTDPQVSIVPDRLEMFGGHGRALLPQFFAHLLWLCLDAHPEWGREEQGRFVAQFRILERLPWMRTRTRAWLEDRVRPNGSGERGSPAWVFEALRI